MATSLQLINLKPFRLHSPLSLSVPKHRPRPLKPRCSATASATKTYTITLLPGDEIGPEVISVAKNVLNLTGSLKGFEFKFKEMPMGGAVLYLTGEEVRKPRSGRSMSSQRRRSEDVF